MCSESLVLKTYLYFLVWGNSFFGLKECSFGLTAKSLFFKKIDKLFLKVQYIWMVQDLSVLFSSTSFFGFTWLHRVSVVSGNSWHGALWKKIQFLLDLKIALKILLKKSHLKIIYNLAPGFIHVDSKVVLSILRQIIIYLDDSFVMTFCPFYRKCVRSETYKELNISVCILFAIIDVKSSNRMHTS